jgi:hypothetical protein
VGGGIQNWVHSARRPLTGLLYLPRVIVRMENLVEWMAGETEVHGENLPRRHFVHHKSHLTRPGGSQRLIASAMARPCFQLHTGFEIHTAVAMNSLIFWDIKSCSPFNVNWRFGETYRLYFQGRKISQARNIFNCFTLDSSLAYSSDLKMEATCSSETSVDFQRTTRRYIPEDNFSVTYYPFI